MERTAGVLLAISSLPSDYGIGCFSKEAYEFVDWLDEAGQSMWQILPLCPTSFGDSPYQSFSTFAGNPYFIDLEKLISKNWLTEEECRGADFGSDRKNIDYEKLYAERYPLLRKAFERSGVLKSENYQKFVSDNRDWLEDYALFMAVKESFNGASWDKWDREIRLREETSMKKYRSELSEEIEFHKFLQYEFYDQWQKLKEYANGKGIKIIGDIPIYVAFDSADVWANPELFQLDSDNQPVAVAGCPPDGFSASGQLWGNPLYDWEYHKKTGYKWWINRLSVCFSLYDVVRIDHFRGFDEYYSIPFGADNAVNGSWEKGPGIEFFKAVEEVLGERKFIAEDLGFITDSVKQLVRKSGFPNMKVLEFAFDSRDTGSRNDYLPHNYPQNCVAYTGTHDNQTIISWYETISEEEQKMTREYLCDFYTPSKKLNDPLIGAVMRSQADSVIIPIQDYLGLDDSCRMNTPSTVGENWKWRLLPGELSEELKAHVLKFAETFSRMKN